MDQIFDFLFSNPLLAFIIIGALFSFFKSGSNSAEEQKKKQAEQRRRQSQQRQNSQQGQTQRQQPSSTSRTRTMESRTEKYERNTKSEETKKRTSPLRDLKESIEREISKVLDERSEEPEVNIPIKTKNAPEERLTIRRDNREIYENKGYEANFRREQEVKNLVSQYTHAKFKKTFLTSLDKEGLINSVIMAEVLGKPRALDPYRPPTSRK